MPSLDQRQHDDLRSRIGWVENRLQEIPQGMAIERASWEGELRKTKAQLEEMDIPERWPQQIVAQNSGNRKERTSSRPPRQQN